MATRFPVKYDLTCYKGQDYCRNLRFKNRKTKEVYPLTGYTAKAEIKQRDNSPRVIAEMSATVTEAEGMISLALSQEQTAMIASGNYVWDLYTSHNGKKQYWIRGKFIVSGRVTV